MSEEETTPRDADSDEDAPDSMEAVLAEALEDEDSSDDDDDRDSIDGGAPSVDEVDIRDALRAAMAPPTDRISITRNVQKRLREDPELEGRYFADGWSTAKAPIETFLITSAVMLVVVVAVYLLIRPYGM